MKITKVRIEIDCNSAAFESAPITEIMTILERIPHKIAEQMDRRPCACTADEAADKLLNTNGNTVGRLVVDME